MRLVALIALLLALANASRRQPKGSSRTPPKGRGEHCVADTDYMRRNHMSMMKHQRDETVHEGVRGKPFSIAGCVDCHAVKGADGQPVSYSEPEALLPELPRLRGGFDRLLRVPCFAARLGEAAQRTRRPFPRTWPSRRLTFRRALHEPNGKPDRWRQARLS